MKKIIWFSFIIGFFILMALVVYLRMVSFETTLYFQVRDAASGAWVWDFTAGLQNRALRGYYQSDQGLTEYHFTKLKPGDWEMSVTAPSYEAQKVAVHLKRGKNVIPEPVDMRGYEIRDLQRFYVFTDIEGRDIVVELRPVNSLGKAILNHPCLDIWIGCRVSVQMKDGVYVSEPTEEGSTYGEELYRGNIPWEWDPSPSTTFRYRARIRASDIMEHKAPYRVIDYLIIVPDPRIIDSTGIHEIINSKVDSLDFEKLNLFLDRYKDRLKYYTYHTWNVPKI